MKKAGFDIKPIESVIVPKGEARIRVQLSAAHTKDHLDTAIKAFTQVGKILNVI